MLTISTFGTSLTARGGWQAPLAHQLTLALNSKVAVINRGKSGASSEWGVTAAPAVAAEAPDIVLIEFAVNDAALNRGLVLSASLGNMTRIVSSLRAGAPYRLIILQIMNPVWGYRRWLRPFLDHYTSAHLILAESLGLPVIDHRPLWAGFDGPALKKAIPDGGHPDAALMADAVATSICDQLIALPEFSRVAGMA